MGLKKSEYLNARETFEHYEANRSRPNSQNLSFDSLHQQNAGRSPVLACEYKGQSRSPVLACEYTRQPGYEYKGHSQPALACEYMENPNDNRPYLTPVANTIEKFKIPFGWIVCGAITIPIFIVIVLFGAVWLQELGWF
ncbi:hypothetical protein WR25_21247 [Diploscapter pachys]|uniref:Uncharacterized protein n=1 Tax=Diploscapter pachys TaxID=2018661 RepID=A0A2A2JDG5_9BILA|nr:hypothetical protein WR25_21247 [Diploscapter pachys]